MSFKLLPIVILSLFLILHSRQSFSQEPQIKSVDINALVNMMEGSFSSEEQSKNDTDYFDIRLHMKKIWSDNQNGKWIYAEMTAAENPDKPYTQRVYHITQTGNNSFESSVFKISNPLRFAGEWKNENPLSSLTSDSLKELEGCDVYFTLVNDTVFQGSTRDSACPGGRSDAKYVTSEVSITKNEIIRWDRGFDENGTQLWGPAKGGYVFKRIDE